MKYYLIAGEASGDLHAANLMKAIKEKDPHAEFRFWGGDLMQNVGGKLVKHYKELAFMGFLEVVLNLRTILKNLSFCKKDIADYNPDLVIMIDYPGFNLRMAKYVKSKLGIKISYYISPQVWAWKSGRVHDIKKYVDQMLVILPFEQEWYSKYQYETTFVGHPLLDALEQRPAVEAASFKEKWGIPVDKKIIALLPGSRKQEIKKMLTGMLAIRKHFTAYCFVVAGAPSQDKSYYKTLLPKDVILVENDTYALLEQSTAALVTSGTATLETALIGVPEVVCYTGSSISYAIAKRLVKHIKYISLVNLIMDREVVTELIQNDFNEVRIKDELHAILYGEKREQILEDYAILKTKLGGKGASERAASCIVSLINQK